jgi:hypothetical protein
MMADAAFACRLMPAIIFSAFRHIICLHAAIFSPRRRCCVLSRRRLPLPLFFITTMPLFSSSFTPVARYSDARYAYAERRGARCQMARRRMRRARTMPANKIAP